MKKIILAAACTWIVMGSPASAGEQEEQFFAAFENFCIGLLNEPKKIPEMVEAIGGKYLPEKTARMFLQGKPGRVWFLTMGQMRASITLTDKDVCSMFGKDIDGKEVQRVFEAFSSSRKFNEEDVGSQKYVYYVLNQPDQSGGKNIEAIIMLTRSNLASLDGVFLNALPKRLAKREGISVPEWK
jgi:hypothetical protein